MDEHLYAVIMAGGGGTRLWPLSRQEHPKQMLRLVEDRTLFQISVDRLLPLLPLERILVVTAADQVEALMAQYPELPLSNYVVEPMGRGTAPCIGLAALAVQNLDPDAVMMVVTADHYIENVEAFRASMEAAAQIARGGYLVTLGIEPTYPSTGYGYIHLGPQLGKALTLPYFEVTNFTEKPDRERAEKFLAAGGGAGQVAQEGAYVWNSGMFVWHVSRILEEIAQWMPDLSTVLVDLTAAQSTGLYEAHLSTLWPKLKKEMIDYGVMERAQRVAVVPVDIGWSDIGTWASVMDAYDADTEGNVVTGDALSLDTHRTMVLAEGKRLVVTVGVDELIIVDTPDAILITRRDMSERVREVVNHLETTGRRELL